MELNIKINKFKHILKIGDPVEIIGNIPYQFKKINMKYLKLE
jgi:hypothetical protein